MSLNARQSTESRQAEIIATVVALAAERNPADVTTTDIAKGLTLLHNFHNLLGPLS